MNTQQENHINESILLCPKEPCVYCNASLRGGTGAVSLTVRRFYVQETSHGNLKRLLRQGAEKRAERDLFLAEEWFNIE